jgi:hypothetical protein
MKPITQGHHRLAPATVGPARPVGGHDHPEQRRPGISEAYPDVGNAKPRADRGHDGLHGSIARRRDQHDRKKQGHALFRQADGTLAHAFTPTAGIEIVHGWFIQC